MAVTGHGKRIYRFFEKGIPGLQTGRDKKISYEGYIHVKQIKGMQM
jgi:hypothetical protein